MSNLELVIFDPFNWSDDYQRAVYGASESAGIGDGRLVARVKKEKLKRLKELFL